MAHVVYNASVQSLYLTRSHARAFYICANCGAHIARGSVYFRHDPAPYARWDRGHESSHWCHECIVASVPEATETSRRFIVPAVRVARTDSQTVIQPVCVEFLPFSAVLSERLCADPELVHQLTPAEFEQFVCERLFAMGFEPRQVGRTNQGDGGIDILFWPRLASAFPILGAAQVKHRRDPHRKVPPAAVREFASVLAGHPFNAGLLVTNTSFTPTAEWYAREHSRLLRLRGFEDIRRWLAGNFSDEAEWREIPESIEVAPGLVVPIRRRRVG